MRAGLLISVLLAGGAFAAAPPLQQSPASESDIVGRYLTATREQQSALRGASMQVDIDASVPKLKKQGKLKALRTISKIGIITYRMLGFNGDNSVKKEVIARYMAAEIESQAGPNLAISPENYKFKFKGAQVHEGRVDYVLSVSPRKKVAGLFKGEIWLDPQTYMPVRESGRFVKNPSIFLKRVEFVRDYEMRNGIAIPQHMQSKAETRLFGPVELSINFTNFAKDSGPETVAFAPNDGQQ